VQFLTPEWPVPPNVHAAFTLRSGGVSTAPFASLNLGAHVGDQAAAVAENRRRVRTQLRLPHEPAWMEQVHGTEVLDLDLHGPARGITADAAFTRRAGPVCAVQVADCLPVLLAVSDGSAVAAAHAGWRGLVAGVLEASVKSLTAEPRRLLAWLGPGICAAHFEVGDEVRSAFLARDPGAAREFASNDRDRWQCDLAGLARRRLTTLGVSAIFGGDWCTYADTSRFFSYRRDGRCGRMAALIWRDD
jgi:YfiH family protein